MVMSTVGIKDIYSHLLYTHVCILFMLKLSRCTAVYNILLEYNAAWCGSAYK